VDQSAWLGSLQRRKRERTGGAGVSPFLRGPGGYLFFSKNAFSFLQGCSDYVGEGRLRERKVIDGLVAPMGKVRVASSSCAPLF